MRALPVLALVACMASGSVAHAEPVRQFQARIAPITAAQQEQMNGASWHEGCPVAPTDLASITMRFIGFDGAVHEGRLVVHRRLASEVVEIFRELFDAGFQIERMQPYEEFGVGQYAAQNATVGFYCQRAQDDPSVFSWHAYGLAVDLNAMTNPFLDPKEGWWPKGSNGDRGRAAPGLIGPRSQAVRVFMRYGWAWGGIEKNPDYMHFAKVTVGDDSNPLRRPVWAERLQDAQE